ncbi:maleylpyruvate isomerase family mycothiol-dependent enzyme [Streptomyces sp. NPDC004111]|uniref:maleylpyruvate isomerase family mycothiol-dependent enzyme n=1 Tax=Streptomyces sp. NPDC004111 TaxID=3364690 RepID=UPI0036885F8E
MTLLDHARYCDQIVEETARMRAAVSGADLGAQVPSCPEWTLRDLLHHTGWAHRWVHQIVSKRSPEVIPPADVPHGDGPGTDDPAALDAWLAEGAEMCAAALREAGPEAQVWTWAPAGRPAAFWARRMTHETVVHRADAALAAGTPYEVDPEVAADAIDEWMWIGALPQTLESRPDLRELFGAGRTVHFHATDTDPALDAEWIIDFTGTAIEWRRGHEKAAVALRGPLTDLLQVFYRRQSPDAGKVEVHGDRALLDQWLGKIAFD